MAALAKAKEKADKKEVRKKQQAQAAQTQSTPRPPQQPKPPKIKARLRDTQLRKRNKSTAEQIKLEIRLFRNAQRQRPEMRPVKKPDEFKP